jgi:predicted CXXCH cytochrome family protein
VLAIGVFLALAGGSAIADVENTVHNLTPTGPGTLKNPDPVGMCRFCHTPHRARLTTALWNRSLSSQVYNVYESSTLDALPGQPTGSSRLCLSCHDGTIALGSVLRTGSEPVAPLGPLTGTALVDADLSDDHPVSFVFDESLAAANGELVSPSTLTAAVKLDPTGQVQCTSCHDPHSDQLPKFLVMPVEDGELCVACHVKRGWSDGSHATSPAMWNGFGEDPWPESDFATVAQNACLSCHDPHAAAHPERLLLRESEEAVCLACHNGNVAETDVETELQKISAHPVEMTSGLHDPPENPLAMDRHVACMDCHNPHAVQWAPTRPPEVSGQQRYVRGVDLGGTPIGEATFAYEICLRCHGVGEAPAPRVVRFDHETNVRLEVHPSNPSYHPVVSVGTNPQAITLIPPLTASSQIYCHDCHNSDEANFPGPSTPLGPHGSDHEPILRGAYPLVDFVEESSEVYALCYTCHDEELLRTSASFEHKRHLENAKAPCAACHDPHGSRLWPHMINFLRFDEMGREVVRPSINTGRLEFVDLGNGRGRCYLNCHGEEHDPRGYIGPDKEE